MSLSREQANQTRDTVLTNLQQRSAQTIGLGRMANKVGVITGVGPAAGIGSQTARVFAREGAKAIYLVDVSKDLPGFAEELGKIYPKTKVTAVVGDAASAAIIKGAIDQALSEEGRFDFFYANAGVSMLRPEGAPPNGVDPMVDFAIARRSLAELPEEEWSEVMRINALSVYVALKYSQPAMAVLGGGKEVPGGTVVATASIAGLRANAGPIAYSASKAAIVSMVQNGAYMFAGQNIRVNAICPGLIQTDMTKLIFTAAKMIGQEDVMADGTPLLRHGLPEEIAQAALWLSSDESSFVNGQSIAVDGALTSSVPFDPKRRQWLQAQPISNGATA